MKKERRRHIDADSKAALRPIVRDEREETEKKGWREMESDGVRGRRRRTRMGNVTYHSKCYNP